MTRLSAPSRRSAVVAFAMLVAVPASCASITAVHRFANTGSGTPSQFALGANPYSELLQASDGNFYGTTQFGGTGLCGNSGGSITGCGTIFRMTQQGAITTLYSFQYDTASETAANGAYPTSGLIQSTDGFLYGVARSGGFEGVCNSSLGCGTLFRISTSGAFTLLHQFQSCGAGCMDTSEGAQPMAHLVQLPDRSLCGTTAQGGYRQAGSVFCASTKGAINTMYKFQYGNGVDGINPVAALLVGSDGTTLYGTTKDGGANGGGTVFSLKGGSMTVLHAFDGYESSTPGTFFFPQSALIFGQDGRLYGTTYAGGDGGCIFSLNTDASGFAANYVFSIAGQGTYSGIFPQIGLVLARDGMMYGTTWEGSVKADGNNDGTTYRFDPSSGKFKGLASFTTPTGAAPYGALIEGKDNTLYGTTTIYGGSNKFGTDEGTIFRLNPALAK